ncbi:2Fe-2S iron-sulfur cluster binding domain-containing protein [Gordonia sp. HNM0687]|uniref:2Fe-2S iron-sulfur cluster binding domain-containing protein n=1 Tax=Gordonia mangrovi TaxID=2665643 RepID=A0A6L7GSG9_9ACTN|nr:hybrid-cluster NAD(P)-dependent oxidoreductase [Gordonia mangrovi]MXP21478.1 2Fe-2S iron-sulfur cluster binding domain-containing protein [Gordonia mangrovi]UVF80223.1 hybrid-cluster NAD(P)-dependent oxidoreductase [Gordonia mangrovi]
MADDIFLQCVSRAHTTRDMATFSFRVAGGSPQHTTDGPDDSRTFVFAPGQFLSITIEIDGRTVQRCYSISSPPTRPGTVSITVKRVSGGHVSNWLHDNMVEGMMIAATGPLGRFTYTARPAEKYLFISAGSGITPVMSMLRAVTDSESPLDITFVHSARNVDDIPFRDELDDLAHQHPNVTLAFAATRMVADELPEWTGHRGRIDRAMLERVCPDLADREVFLCGPGRFRSEVRSSLMAAGADLARIHEESFGFSLPTDDESDAGSGVMVDFSRRARRVTVAPGSTILAAAAKAGVTLPSSCGVGLCGSCKVRKLSGDVVMNHQGGIRPREIAQGKILLCCSEPLSPVVIDY